MTIDEIREALKEVEAIVEKIHDYDLSHIQDILDDAAEELREVLRAREECLWRKNR